ATASRRTPARRSPRMCSTGRALRCGTRPRTACTRRRLCSSCSCAEPARLLGHEPHHQLVHVAPAPVLARLYGADDRMLCLVVMSGRVAVGGVVAAADLAAL